MIESKDECLGADPKFWGCCCQCKHQVKIYKHPWNTGDSNGSMLELFSYGCLEFDRVTIMQREHSLCEEFERK